MKRSMVNIESGYVLCSKTDGISIRVFLYIVRRTNTEEAVCYTVVKGWSEKHHSFNCIYIERNSSPPQNTVTFAQLCTLQGIRFEDIDTKLSKLTP